jgi:tRNA-binding EMAP/Myf-like protein
MQFTIVYQPQLFPDTLFVVLAQHLAVSEKKVTESIVRLYHQNQLIGINLFAVPQSVTQALPEGMQRTLTHNLSDYLKPILAKDGLDVNAYHSGFVHGEILAIDVHPESELLKVCQVNLASNTIQVVTNSTKLKVQDRIVVAIPGAMLLDGSVLQEGMMIKVLSQGMFCSEKTLGISPATQVGVVVFNQQTKIGSDFYARS